MITLRFIASIFNFHNFSWRGSFLTLTIELHSMDFWEKDESFYLMHRYSFMNYEAINMRKAWRESDDNKQLM